MKIFNQRYELRPISQVLMIVGPMGVLAVAVALLVVGVNLREIERNARWQAMAEQSLIDQGYQVQYLGVVTDELVCRRPIDHGQYYFRVTSPGGAFPVRAKVCVMDNGFLVVDWMLHEWDEP